MIVPVAESDMLLLKPLLRSTPCSALDSTDPTLSACVPVPCVWMWTPVRADFTLPTVSCVFPPPPRMMRTPLSCAATLLAMLTVRSPGPKCSNLAPSMPPETSAALTIVGDAVLPPRTVSPFLAFPETGPVAEIVIGPVERFTAWIPWVAPETVAAAMRRPGEASPRPAPAPGCATARMPSAAAPVTDPLAAMDSMERPSWTAWMPVAAPETSAAEIVRRRVRAPVAARIPCPAPPVTDPVAETARSPSPSKEAQTPLAPPAASVTDMARLRRVPSAPAAASLCTRTASPPPAIWPVAEIAAPPVKEPSSRIAVPLAASTAAARISTPPAPLAVTAIPSAAARTASAATDAVADPACRITIPCPPLAIRPADTVAPAAPAPVRRWMPLTPVPLAVAAAASTAIAAVPLPTTAWTPDSAPRAVPARTATLFASARIPCRAVPSTVPATAIRAAPPVAEATIPLAPPVTLPARSIVRLPSRRSVARTPASAPWMGAAPDTCTRWMLRSPVSVSAVPDATFTGSSPLRVAASGPSSADRLCAWAIGPAQTKAPGAVCRHPCACAGAAAAKASSPAPAQPTARRAILVRRPPRSRIRRSRPWRLRRRAPESAPEAGTEACAAIDVSFAGRGAGPPRAAGRACLWPWS